MMGGFFSHTIPTPSHCHHLLKGPLPSLYNKWSFVLFSLPQYLCNRRWECVELESFAPCRVGCGPGGLRQGGPQAGPPQDLQPSTGLSTRVVLLWARASGAPAWFSLSPALCWACQLSHVGHKAGSEGRVFYLRTGPTEGIFNASASL